jgi:hypothetical protein
LYNESENRKFLFDLLSISSDEIEYEKAFFDFFKLNLVAENIKIIMYDSCGIIDIQYKQYGIKFIKLVDLKISFF